MKISVCRELVGLHLLAELRNAQAYCRLPSFHVL
jgi:hypothetical protein